MGGVAAFGVGTEHQQVGTPHGHGQAHIVCLYQYATLEQIANKIKEGFEQATQDSTLIESMKAYRDWMHVEHTLDENVSPEYADKVEKDFFSGFSDLSHSSLCQTPPYLQEDAFNFEEPSLANCYNEDENLAQVQQVLKHGMKHGEIL